MTKNLAIIGYGKMGRLIEQLAPEAGFSVGLKLDIDSNVDQLAGNHARKLFRAWMRQSSSRCPTQPSRILSGSARSAFPP